MFVEEGDVRGGENMAREAAHESLQTNRRRQVLKVGTEEVGI